MPSASEFSADPNSNGTIGGSNVAENCPAANLNNALRYTAAVIRVMFDGLPNTANLVTKAGGVFTDNPIFNGRGAFLYHNDSSLTSGRIFVQPAGGSAPAGMVNGDLLFEY